MGISKNPVFRQVGFTSAAPTHPCTSRHLDFLSIAQAANPTKIIPTGGYAALDPPCMSEFLEVPLCNFFA
jgi:hypothetical protein